MHESIRTSYLLNGVVALLGDCMTESTCDSCTFRKSLDSRPKNEMVNAPGFSFSDSTWSIVAVVLLEDKEIMRKKRKLMKM